MEEEELFMQITLAMVRKTMSYRYAVFILISLAYILVYFHRTSVAVMTPELTADFGIATTAIGLFGSMYFYAYALCQLPAGLLADHWGVRKTTSSTLLMASIGTGIFGWANTFSQALVSRFLVGMGVAFIYVSAMRVLADWFKHDEFTIYCGIFVSIGNAGSLMSAAPLVALMTAFGWRRAMTFISGITIVIVFLLFLFMRNKPADIGGADIADIEGSEVTGYTSLGVGESLQIVIKKYNFWTIAILFFVWYGTQMGFQALWAGPYLMNVYQLGKTQTGNILLFIPLGLIFGSTIAGIIADRIIKSKKKVVMIGVAMSILTWLILIFMIDSMSLPVIKLIMLIFGVFSGFEVVLWTNLKENIDPRIFGTGSGFLNIFVFSGAAIYQQILGVIIAKAPVVEGLLATSGFRAAFIFCAVSLSVAFMVFATQKHSTRY
jgi:sugar phosphate permease